MPSSFSETSRRFHSIHLYVVYAGVARYKILVKTIVMMEYEAIAEKFDRRRVLGTIASLLTEPRPAGAKNLPERDNHLRIYLGPYRLLYGIDDQKGQITVFRIAKHRRKNFAG
jgi:mRNA-degrading endonuclease RelE of RelBE toxin-antitoxin system